VIPLLLAIGAAILAAVIVPVLVFIAGEDSQAWPSAALSLDREWEYVVPGDDLHGYFSIIELCYRDCPIEERKYVNIQGITDSELREEIMDSELYSAYFRSPVVVLKDRQVVEVTLLGSPPPRRAYFYALPFEIAVGSGGGFVQIGTIRGYPAVAVWYTSEAFGDGFAITVLEGLPTQDKPGIYTSVPASYRALDTAVAEVIIDGRNSPD
jgi:hypothetical protein